MVDIWESMSETTGKIQNNVLRSVFAWSPHNHPPRYVYLKTSSATVKPGMPVIRGTAAGGEGTCAPSAGTSILVFGISEWDPKQILNCNTAYASGDLIPVIPIYGNEGVICRNLHITDPNGDIAADVGFQSGAALFVIGDATGMILVRSLTFIADASDPDWLVAYIAPSLDVAA